MVLGANRLKEVVRAISPLTPVGLGAIPRRLRRRPPARAGRANARPMTGLRPDFVAPARGRHWYLPPPKRGLRQTRREIPPCFLDRRSTISIVPPPVHASQIGHRVWLTTRWRPAAPMRHSANPETISSRRQPRLRPGQKTVSFRRQMPRRQPDYFGPKSSSRRQRPVRGRLRPDWFRTRPMPRWGRCTPMPRQSRPRIGHALDYPTPPASRLRLRDFARPTFSTPGCPTSRQTRPVSPMQIPSPGPDRFWPIRHRLFPKPFARRSRWDSRAPLQPRAGDWRLPSARLRSCAARNSEFPSWTAPAARARDPSR